MASLPGMMFFGALAVIGYGVLYGDTWLIWLGVALAAVSAFVRWVER